MNRFEGGDVPFGYSKVDSPRGERTRQDGAVDYIEPDPRYMSIAGDLLRRGYSSRLARGEFVARGYNVSHVAIAKLFRKTANRMRNIRWVRQSPRREE